MESKTDWKHFLLELGKTGEQDFKSDNPTALQSFHKWVTETSTDMRMLFMSVCQLTISTHISDDLKKKSTKFDL